MKCVSARTTQSKRATPTLLDLKKLAILATQDHIDLIRCLKWCKKKKKISGNVLGSSLGHSVDTLLLVGSSIKVSKGEWKNQMVAHGNKKVVVDDAMEIGIYIGVKFSHYNNMFLVLARESGTERKNFFREVEKKGVAVVVDASGMG